MNREPIEIDTVALQPSIHESKDTPFEKLLRLKRQNPRLSMRNIGKLVGISRQAVHSMFLRHKHSFEHARPLALEEFKEMRADIFAMKQIEGLNALTESKLRDAPVNHLVMMIEKLHNAERLDRGQSTGNVEVSIMGLISKMSTAQRGLLAAPVIDAEVVTPIQDPVPPVGGPLLG